MAKSVDGSDIVERLDKSAKHLFVLSPPDERLLFAEAAAEIRRLRCALLSKEQVATAHGDEYE